MNMPFTLNHKFWDHPNVRKNWKKKTLTNIKCLGCGVIFSPSVHTQKYHNRRCFIKNHKVWNKGLTKDDVRVMRYTLSKIGKKRPELSGENNSRWRGDKVGYSGIHQWIRNIFGKANCCEMCTKDNLKRYEWASINGEYSRDRSGWISLCKSCHVKYDRVHEKMWKTLRRNPEKYKRRINKISEKLKGHTNWNTGRTWFKSKNSYGLR